MFVIIKQYLISPPITLFSFVQIHFLHLFRLYKIILKHVDFFPNIVYRSQLLGENCIKIVEIGLYITAYFIRLIHNQHLLFN